MTNYKSVSVADLKTGIYQTEQVIEANKKYLAYLATGSGLPTLRAAREQLVDSVVKCNELLEKEVAQMQAEIGKRP